MFKRVIVILILILFLTSCNQGSISYPIRDIKTHSTNLVDKTGIPLLLTEHKRIHSIDTDMFSFVSVNEWYDQETLLFLTDENGISLLSKFHLYRGEKELFFQIEEPIIQVNANPDFSIFAIEVAALKGGKIIYFVDKQGIQLYEFKDISEDYQLYWNPFQKGELLIAVLKEDYSIQLYSLDVMKRNLRTFDFDYTYVQWITENELAYLKWDLYSPSYYAPLFTYDLNSNQHTKKADEIIAFFTFFHYLVTVSIDHSGTKFSQYQFYDMKTNQMLMKFEVPILNTYSEQWWIPSHDFYEHSKTFYYIKPETNGDIFNYDDGFELVSFQIETGKERVIERFSTNYPLKLSPDGRLLLYGFQLEMIVDLKKNETNRLIHW